MIRKKVYSPILFFILLLCIGSCTNPINEDAGKYKSLTDKGERFFDKKVHLDSAFYYFNRAKESCTNKTGEDYAYSLLQIATVQKDLGDFYGSEESVTEAMANYKGTVYQPYLYNILAIDCDSRGQLDDALQYYRKAYENFEDSTAKTLAQNNIGLIYQEKNQHERAIQVLKPLLGNRNRKIDNALILGNLGYSQFKLNRSEGLSNLLKSKQLTDSLQDIAGSVTINIHLAEFYEDIDKLKSRRYALDALHAAKKVNNPDKKLQALRKLVEISDGMNAKQYSVAFIQLNDSLNHSRESAKNQFAKMKYDSKKANENQQKYEKNMWGALGLTLLITISALIVFYYIRKRASERLKGSVNETETRISKKIHDELANDVYQAIAFTETQDLENQENKDALLDNLGNIYAKARDISQTNSEIYTDERYGDSLLDLINGFSGNEVNIITKDFDTIDWSKINEHAKNAIYRVVQELLVNMKKHSEADLVMLNFKMEPKLLEIKYTDNGKGVDPIEFSKKGLQYAENRIHAINGTFTFDKETVKGFRVTIQIPK